MLLKRECLPPATKIAKFWERHQMQNHLLSCVLISHFTSDTHLYAVGLVLGLWRCFLWDSKLPDHMSAGELMAAGPILGTYEVFLFNVHQGLLSLVRNATHSGVGLVGLCTEQDFALVP